MMGNFLTTLGNDARARTARCSKSSGLNVARQPDNARQPAPGQPLAAGWSGETPDVVEELLAGRSPSPRRRGRAGADVRLWDPSTQLRFQRQAHRAAAPRRRAQPQRAGGRRGSPSELRALRRARSERDRAAPGGAGAARIDRRLRLVSGPQGPTVLLDGKPVLLLCSNNYLGLADHPRVREAAAEAAMRWGVGAGASRLVSGTMTIHRRLEERLAAFEGREACVLFGSGYLANVGVDRSARPDAARRSSPTSSTTPRSSTAAGCSRAEVVVYRHRDVEHLDWCLRRHGGQRRRAADRDRLGVLDGRRRRAAEEIVELAQELRRAHVVDEAHAIGSLGPDGRGAVAAGRPRGRGRRRRRAPSARRSAPTARMRARAPRSCAT